METDKLSQLGPFVGVLLCHAFSLVGVALPMSTMVTTRRLSGEVCSLQRY